MIIHFSGLLVFGIVILGKSSTQTVSILFNSVPKCIEQFQSDLIEYEE